MIRYVPRNPAPTSGFPCPDDMDPLIYQVLVSRGITSTEEADAFLTPALDQLHDPFLLSDMETAVAVIQKHLAAGSHITVYGDYDVDGITASSIMYRYLKSIDADVSVYIPNRHSEGYGLNDDAIRTIAEKTQLLITVDCGVSNKDQISIARSLGAECIVTDHHHLPDVLPDCPIINPLLNNYPFPYLCGAGVAFQLVRALGGDEAALEYIDLAAMGTVADLVSLTGENRVIVSFGLKKINEEPNNGIAALIRVAGLSNKTIGSGNIGFQLAPRINAGGRVSSPMIGFELLTTEDAARADELAIALNRENEQRRELEQSILDECESMLAQYDFVQNHMIVLCGENWNTGVVGLTASRIQERYHMPVIVFSKNADSITGSCRSIPCVDIHAVLTNCADLMTRFGGHKAAAGLTMPYEKLSEFMSRSNRFIEETCDMSGYIPTVEYDCAPDLAAIDLNTITMLECFQPIGIGNPGPIFLAQGEMMSWRTVGADNQTLKFELGCDSGRYSSIGFRMVSSLQRPVGGYYEMLFTPSVNEFGGRSTIQFQVKSLKQSDNRERESETLRAMPRFRKLFLNDRLYRVETIHTISQKRAILTKDELCRTLTKTSQGTLVICASCENAFRLLRDCGSVHELYINAFPQDPISHNAICLLPCGDLPDTVHYENIVLYDLPSELFPFHSVSGVKDGRLTWPQLLPDIDGLRQIYKAMKDLIKDGTMALNRLQDSVSAKTGLPVETVAAGIAVYKDLTLISIINNVVSLLPMRKVDPTKSAVFRVLRNWGTQSS